MRSAETKRTCRVSNHPVYDFDSDATLERVIRDPLAVLLSRSALSLQSESSGSDPYNRIGRWVRNARR